MDSQTKARPPGTQILMNELSAHMRLLYKNNYQLEIHTIREQVNGWFWTESDCQQLEETRMFPRTRDILKRYWALMRPLVLNEDSEELGNIKAEMDYAIVTAQYPPKASQAETPISNAQPDIAPETTEPTEPIESVSEPSKTPASDIKSISVTDLEMDKLDEILELRQKIHESENQYIQNLESKNSKILQLLDEKHDAELKTREKTGEIENLEAELEKAEKEILNLRKDNEWHKMDSHAADVELDLRKSQVINLEEKLEQKTSEFEKSELRRQHLEWKVDQKPMDYDKAMDTMEAELQEAKELAEKLKNENEELKNGQKEGQKSMREYEREIQDLLKRRAKLAKIAGRFRTESRVLQEKLTVSESRQEYFAVELERKVKMLSEKRLVSVDESVSRDQGLVDQNSLTEIQKLRRQNEELEKDVEIAKYRRQNMERMMIEQSKNLDTLARENHNLKKQIEEDTNLKEIFQEMLDKKTSEVEKLQQKNEEVLKKLEDSEARCQALDRFVVDQKTDIESVLDINDDLKKEVTEEKENFKKALEQKTSELQKLEESIAVKENEMSKALMEYTVVLQNVSTDRNLLKQTLDEKASKLWELKEKCKGLEEKLVDQKTENARAVQLIQEHVERASDVIRQQERLAKHQKALEIENHNLKIDIEKLNGQLKEMKSGEEPEDVKDSEKDSEDSWSEFEDVEEGEIIVD